MCTILPKSLALAALVVLLTIPFTAQGAEEVLLKDGLSGVNKLPEQYAGATVEAGKATLQADKWSYLLSKTSHDHFQAQLQFTIQQSARTFTTGGHGGDWNAYRFHAYDDAGYEVGVLLRAAGTDSGYRVQVSTKYQEVALLKYPFGSFLRVVPCEVKLNQPYRLEVSAQANEIIVKLDGKELIRYADTVLPLDKGNFGIGVGASGKVLYESVTLTPLPAKEAVAEKPHVADFRVRDWRGQRWVFDGQEPIMLLFTPALPYFQNVKLKPGYRCMLLWDAGWGIANQGAYADGAAKLGEATVGKQGQTLELTWQAKNVKDSFVINTKMVVRYDDKRKMYAYDVDSALDLLKDFEFRFGFDFEHHTPLGPFYSQYLVLTKNDKHFYRPVYPIDPGAFSGMSRRGIRMWYGRTNETRPPAMPAVEYDISPGETREMSTAVCACMYDTGIAFNPEKTLAGTKVAVRYRYTGYPADEAERIFKSATVYPTPTLDPTRHLIFADYPKTTFGDFRRLDEPWWGKRPFVTAHNLLPPRYFLEKNTGFHGGFAMRLSAGGDCAASLPTPKGPLPRGKYVVSAYVKGDNIHGPGGYLDLIVTDQQLVHGYTGGHVRSATKVLKEQRHWIGNGTFAWKRTGFVTELISEAPALAVGLGNAGSGDLLVTDLEILPLKEGETPPADIAAKASPAPAISPAPEGAIADYRMEEGKGHYVFDYARGKLGILELANLDWVVDDGRPALRFADNTTGRKAYPRGGTMSAYLDHSAYLDKQTVPVAIAGIHGGGFEVKAFTISAFMKPAEQMGKAEHGNSGDIVGLGARRVVLRLQGRKAPYHLEAALDVNDRVAAQNPIEAGRWYHVAVTGAQEGKDWRVRLFVDGKQVQEGTTKKLAAPTMMSPSLILGAELFYLHDSYYRGLIGRTTVFDRALDADAIQKLAAGK
jgi:hypothetical protein